MKNTLNLIKNQILDPVKIQALKLQKQKDGLYYTFIQENKMALHLEDEGINRELALIKIHEPKSTEYLKAILKKNMLVIDIGANIGYYALIEAKAGAKVIAFEPTPKNIEILKKNIEINKFENQILVSDKAISDKKGTEKLYLGFSNSGNSMIPLNENHILIKSVTLDEYLSKQNIKKVDIIRMDIEGGELKAVKGMEKLLTENPPKHLFIELHPVQLASTGYSIKEITEIIYSFGYEIRKVFYESDPTSIKIGSTKETVKRALKSGKFWKTIFARIKGLKIQKEYNNKKDFLSNPFLYSHAAEVFFELKK